MYKLIFAWLLLLPATVSAEAFSAAGSGLDVAAEGTGLNRGIGLAGWINLIIRGVLTLLAVIFITLIIIGGFKWMTSQGNTEQIKEAKGLYAIVFDGVVTKRLAEAAEKYSVSFVVGRKRIKFRDPKKTKIREATFAQLSRSPKNSRPIKSDVKIEPT